MNTVFPFGFPWYTAFYLVLYTLTLVIHVAFMNYVLAGSGYLAVATLMPRRSSGESIMLPAADVLRDWLPAMLSGAITAGVAPLLFVQILYKHSFYTANLLGFHRWMAILPVLILAFYLLYVLRSRSTDRLPNWLRLIIAAIVFGCFSFVAYSWTENHLLSIQDQQTWSEEYAREQWFYQSPRLIPRLAMWFIGAIPTMILLVSWQLWYVERNREAASGVVRHMAGTALVGIGLTVACGLWHFIAADSETRSAFWNWLALPYLLLAFAGLALQVFAWLRLMRLPRFDTRLLARASIGTGLTLLGMTVTREAIRIRASAIDITHLLAQHEQASRVGGLLVFLLFFGLNALLVFWCIQLVRRGRAPQTPIDRHPTTDETGTCN